MIGAWRSRERYLFTDRYGDEATFCRLAGQLAKECPRKDRRPAVWNSSVRRSALHHRAHDWMGFQRCAVCGEIGEGCAGRGERKIDVIL